MSLEPLNDTPSLSERAHQAIRESILSLQLRPGEFLSIGKLVEQLGLSRTPVRDALLRLEKEELVRMVPYKGAQICEIAAQDVLEIYELRMVLECYSIRVATAQLTADDFLTLTGIVQASNGTVTQGQYLLASDLGRQLHELLIQKVANRRFIGYLQELDVLYTHLRHLSALIPSRLKNRMTNIATLLTLSKAAIPRLLSRG